MLVDRAGGLRGHVYRICIAPTIDGAANLFIAICEIIEGLLAATVEHVSCMFVMQLRWDDRSACSQTTMREGTYVDAATAEQLFVLTFFD